MRPREAARFLALSHCEDEVVPTLTLAYTTPDVLRCARESVGYELEDAAARIGVNPEKLALAETGEGMLTLRQAERAADVYERPLAALFMPAPPDEEPQEAQFRRLPGAPAPPWRPEMNLLARRVSERQEAAVELLEALEEEPRGRRRSRISGSLAPRCPSSPARFRASGSKSRRAGATCRGMPPCGGGPTQSRTSACS